MLPKQPWKNWVKGDHNTENQQWIWNKRE